MEENLKLIIKAGTQKINPESTPSIINFVRPVKQRRQTISISNSKPSKNFLKENNLSTNVGNEGAFAPNGLPSNEAPLNFIVQAIEKAGLVEQDAERKIYVVKDVITYTDEATGSEITVIPSDHYCVAAMVDFGTKVLGTQNATMKNITEFKKEIQIWYNQNKGKCIARDLLKLIE